MGAGLKIYTSNRIEVLAAKLAQVVREPVGDPFLPEVVVVQSRGMERYAAMAIASHNGVCANFRFPFPNTFLQELFRLAVPNLEDTSPFEPGILTFRIMKILSHSVEEPAFRSIQSYLADDPKQIKLYQLSQKIADTFDQYLVFRPQMIFDWESGASGDWQAQLWRKLCTPNGDMHRAKLRRVLAEKIARKEIPLDKLPARVSVFGISYLPAFHLEAFAGISKLIQVNLFLMNPCREYWSDILTEREMQRVRGRYPEPEGEGEDLALEAGNRLLASLGGVGRHFFSVIHTFESEIYEEFVAEEPRSLLTHIQDDILNLKDRAGGNGDSKRISGSDQSIQINSCHSPMREMEVLHDYLLSLFDADPQLRPKDIVVMTPDMEVYAPYVHAVFDSPADTGRRIPYAVSDQRLPGTSRLISGFFTLLKLKDERLSATQVLELLQIPGVKANFELTETDIPIIERFIADTRIRWGVDAASKREKGLPETPENTWQAGIERLLLGLAMPDNEKTLFNGILPYGMVEGGDAIIYGNFLEFLTRLFRWMERLRQPKPLAGWSIALQEMLSEFFRMDEESASEAQMIRDALNEMSMQAEAAGYEAAVALEVVTAYLQSHFENRSSGAGFLSQGVTFCTLLPMRSIPFKVICLVGMNMDAFPRETRALGFDLIAGHPQPGDRSRRDDDKYLFLESLLSTRERLYISYVGQSIRDNAPIPPSVLVSELIDYLVEAYHIEREQIITCQRLQPFAQAYFLPPPSPLFSYSEENGEAARCMQTPHLPEPFIQNGLPFSDEEAQKWRELELNDLALFFSHPARYLLQKRLNLYLEEIAPLSEEAESFSLSPLEQYGLEQKLLLHSQAGDDPARLLDPMKKAGLLPHGEVGAVLHRSLSAATRTFTKKVRPYTASPRKGPLDVSLEIAGFTISGRLDGFYDNRLVSTVYARFKAKYLLNAWLRHLVAGIAGISGNLAESVLICKDDIWIFESVKDGAAILEPLLALYWEGLQAPLHFFPESAFSYARKLLLDRLPEIAALNAALAKWCGSEFTRGESMDPYYDICFTEKERPIDIFFCQNAETVFGPIFEHAQKG